MSPLYIQESPARMKPCIVGWLSPVDGCSFVIWVLVAQAAKVPRHSASASNTPLHCSMGKSSSRKVSDQCRLPTPAASSPGVPKQAYADLSQCSKYPKGAHWESGLGHELPT